MQNRIKIFLALLLAYLLFYPVEESPEKWYPPALDESKERYSVQNYYLQDIEVFAEQDGYGPESSAFGADGHLYFGFLDGKIIKYNQESNIAEQVFANTNGRVLGLEFDNEQNLIVADAVHGLLSIDIEGNIQSLSTQSDGLPFKFTDDVSVSKNGDIFFTDASYKYGHFDRENVDIWIHKPHGRVLKYSAKNKETNTLLDGLYFANGIALSPKEDYLLVSETASYRIVKYWLTGPNKGKSEYFVENLPGFPDNIDYKDGLFWVAIVDFRQPIIEKLSPHPFIRKIMLRLPESFLPSPKINSCILAFAENGELVFNLQAKPGTAFGKITDINEQNGFLFLGTFDGQGFGKIKSPR